MCGSGEPSDDQTQRGKRLARPRTIDEGGDRRDANDWPHGDGSVSFVGECEVENERCFELSRVEEDRRSSGGAEHLRL